MENFGFDLDGVLHDFTGPTYRYIKEYYGIEQDFYTFWRDADKLFSKNSWDFILNLPELYIAPALKEDIEVVNKIAEKFNIFYVTLRPCSLTNHTLLWLKSQGFPLEFPNLIVESESKRPALELIPMKYYVEDRLHVAESIKDLTTVIIKRTPWNRNARGYKEISKLSELLEIIGD